MARKENLRIRKMIAQLVDKFCYSPENAARCHKQIYRRIGRFLCSVNYDTYMDYLKEPIPDEEFELVPTYFVDGLEKMVCAILSSSSEKRVMHGRRHPSQKSGLRIADATTKRGRIVKR